MQRLVRWWSGLERPYRFNVGLYALATVALAALLFEVVTGSDTSPKQQVASLSSSTTVQPTTTFRPTIPANAFPSSSSTEPATSTTTAGPGPAGVTAPTQAPVITSAPRNTATTPPATSPPVQTTTATTTTEPPPETTTTQQPPTSSTFVPPTSSTVATLPPTTPPPTIPLTTSSVP